jgi:hypothetical protein
MRCAGHAACTAETTANVEMYRGGQNNGNIQTLGNTICVGYISEFLSAKLNVSIL